MSLPRRFVLSLLALLTVAVAVPNGAPSAEKAAKPVDLLKSLNLRRDVVQGRWGAQQRAWVSDTSGTCVIQVPYLPPEEYDIEIDAERLKGNEAFAVVLPIGRNQPSVIFDGRGRTVSGLNRLDGKDEGENESAFRGRVFSDSGIVKIVCQVRRSHIKVVADGKTIVDWKGDMRRLSLFPLVAELPHKGAVGLWTWGTSYRITRMELTPVTGEGEVLK